jgi:hypothetical protein
MKCSWTSRELTTLRSELQIRVQGPGLVVNFHLFLQIMPQIEDPQSTSCTKYTEWTLISTFNASILRHFPFPMHFRSLITPCEITFPYMLDRDSNLNMNSRSTLTLRKTPPSTPSPPCVSPLPPRHTDRNRPHQAH